MIFHTRMLALIKGSVTGRDRYGDEIYGPDREIKFYGELIARDGTEPSEPNRSAVTSEFRILIPSTVKLAAHDRVRVLGDDYDLVGHPAPILIGGRLHHYEANVERREG